MPYTLELETIKLHKTSNRIFSYYTTEEEERESGLGRIHIILEITSKDKPLIAFASELVAVIKDTFFHSPSSDIEASLELACQKANSFFLESAIDHNKCYSKLSCVVFATHENSISFSSITNGRLLLIRKQKINQLIEPLFSKTKKESGKPKLFTNITSGLLEPGDLVIASTKNITDYFNEEKLKNILRQLKLPDAAKAIADEIQKVPSTIGFESALVSFKKRLQTQNQEAKQAIVPLEEQTTVIESMAQMTQRETVTSKLLIESPIASFKKPFKNIFARLKSNVLRPERSITAPKQTTIDPLPQNTLSKPSIVPPSISAEAFGTRIHKMSTVLFVKNRFLTIGALLLILFIVTTLLQTRFISFSSHDTEVITTIKEQLNQAELALIYQNRDGAFAQLKQAKESMSLLKKPTSADAKQLQRSIDELDRKVFLITEFSPESIVDFSTKPELSSAQGVLTAKGMLLSFVSDPFELLEVKQTEKSTNPIPIVTSIKPNRVYGDSDNVVISDGTTLAALDISKKTVTVTSPLASTVFTPYAGRVYAIANSGITRLDRDIKTNTWKSTPWITDGSTIENAISLAIDGDIYVGSNHGVLKFSKGKREPFSLPDIGYALKPSFIATSPESQKLFILDTVKQRIVIVTKAGVLEKQISFEIFEQSVSPYLVVDEVKKAIFIQAGNGIWKLTY